MPPVGLEPTIFGLKVRCLDQLGYEGGVTVAGGPATSDGRVEPDERTPTVGCMFRILFVLALLLGAAACGDDDDAATEPVTGSVDVDDTAAVDDVDDLDDPQGADDDLINAIEAYALTQIEGDPDEIAAARSQGCAEVETALDTETTAGGDGEAPTVSDVEAEVDGEEATVSYRLDPDGTEVADERWVKEDGEWKWDNC